MSDDFLKKISQNKKSSSNNPLDKLFQQKKKEIGIKKPEPVKKEDELDGIEHLGKSTANNDFTFEDNTKEEDKSIEEKIPAKSLEDADVFSNENPVADDDFSKIPAKSLENADIFSENNPTDDDTFMVKTHSSYNNLSLDENNENNENTIYDEKTINYIVNLLKNNKPDEAIKIIADKKNG